MLIYYILILVDQEIFSVKGTKCVIFTKVTKLLHSLTNQNYMENTESHLKKALHAIPVISIETETVQSLIRLVFVKGVFRFESDIFRKSRFERLKFLR